MAKKARTPDPRSGDRHRPRKMVGLEPEMYDQIAAIAARNQRPILWQVRLMLQESLDAEARKHPPAH